jgi:ATP-dependent DNA helicase RecG
MDVPTTIREMHYPTDFATQKKALQRVFYDRLLRIQLYSIIVKQEYQHLTHNVEPLVDRSIIKDIISKLPFELTNAQKKAIKTIIEEFHQPKPMMRLMQGDV